MEITHQPIGINTYNGNGGLRKLAPTAAARRWTLAVFLRRFFGHRALANRETEAAAPRIVMQPLDAPVDVEAKKRPTHPSHPQRGYRPRLQRGTKTGDAIPVDHLFRGGPRGGVE
jgi:hypothetical protein